MGLLIHQNNPQTQQSEYVEPFSETKHSCYQVSTLKGVQLSQQDDEECNSDNSYAALYEESLDVISDSDNSILRREVGELSPTPPREMSKKKKKKKKKKKTLPSLPPPFF